MTTPPVLTSHSLWKTLFAQILWNNYTKTSHKKWIVVFNRKGESSNTYRRQSVADQDLQIRRGRSSRFWDKVGGGGGRSPKKVFRPPWPLPWIRHWQSSESPHKRESRKSRILHSRFQLLDSSLYLWNVDSKFQSLVGFRFQIPGIRIPPAKFSRVLESGFPDMGRSECSRFCQARKII